ncbi:7543_t:CDS:1, partial [Dentiscutata heterogama]
IKNYARLNGRPYIIRYYGTSRLPDKGNYIIVMKYASSGNLENFLDKNTGLKSTEKLKILLHIAEGLEDIHNEKMWHGDFHSKNIVFDGQTPYICDLGCSCSATSSTTYTVGIVPYVAPEILSRGRGKYSKEADVYSFWNHYVSYYFW